MGQNVWPSVDPCDEALNAGTRKDLKMHVSPTRLMVGALAAGGMTLALGSAPVSAASSPEQIVKQAITTSEAATSVKIVGSVAEGTQTISLDVSASTSGAGEGTIGIGKGLATVRLVGGTVYFMGNAKFWTQQVSASAAKLFVGKWVSTAATTSTGSPLAQFLNSGSFMKQLFGSSLENSKFVNAGTAHVGGKTAIVISADNKSLKSEGDLYVAKSGQPYILKVSAVGGKGQAGALTFSQYDQPVNVVAPSGAVDLDTLQSG